MNARTGFNHRLQHWTTRTVLAAAVVLCAAPFAAGDPLQVTSQQKYERLIEAGVGAQIVQTELSLNSRPRVPAGLAALSVVAARNPLATQQQLEAFAEAFDALLQAAVTGDPDLLRSTHLVQAIRFQGRVTGEAGAGLDVDIGSAVLERLGLGVSAASRTRRAEELDRTLRQDLANSAQVGRLLVTTLLGYDANDREHEGLAAAARTFLRARGIEPAPTPTDLAMEYPQIASALSGLPQDYDAFAAARAGGFSGARARVRSETDAVLAGIDTAITSISTTLEANQDTIAAAQRVGDEALVSLLAAQRQAHRRELSGARARIGLNALLVAQSTNPDHVVQVEIARDFSGIALETNETLNDWQAGIEIGGSVLAFAAAVYTGDAASAIGSFTTAVSGIIGIAAPQAPAPEEQIFEQIVELRDQVEGVRLEMNRQFDRVFGRFDSIDQQLNIIYTEFGSSLNQLNETTRQIDGNVQQLQSALVDARVALNRIEQNLYGAIFAGFLQDYIAGADFALGYRARFNQELPFIGSSSFGSFESLFYSWSTSFAGDNTYAGPTALSLPNNAAASDVLDSVPLGVNINNLRQFPGSLGLPVLSSSRLVNPTIWADCAWSYAMLARENPWYFAKLHQNSPSRIADVLLAGDRVRTAMRAARSEALITRLTSDARVRASALASAVATDQQTYVTANFPELGGLDLWADSTQSIVHLGVGPALPPSVHAVYSGLSFHHLPGEEFGRFWEIFPPAIGIALQLGAPGVQLGQFTYSLDVDYAQIAPTRVQARMSLTIVRQGAPVATRVQEATFAAESIDDAQSVVFELFSDNTDDLRITFFDPVGTVYEPRFPLFGVTATGPRETIVHEALVPIAAAADNELAARRSLLAGFLRSRLAQATPMRDAAGLLQASRDLLDAYASIGLPETVGRSDVARAVLRGKDGLGIDAIDALLQGHALGSIRPPAALAQLLHLRIDTLAAEFAPALSGAGTHESHGSLEWSLAHLRDLQANAARLAADDAYFTGAGQALVVPAATGVLVNDAAQLSVARAAGVLLPPMGGSLTLATDGSFAYTPTPGFSGRDSFMYAVTGNLAVPGDPPNLLTSLPATVVIHVCTTDCPGGSVCAADFNADGLLNADDLGDYINCYFAIPACGTVDFNADGFTNADDLGDYINAYFAGCP